MYDVSGIKIRLHPEDFSVGPGPLDKLTAPGNRGFEKQKTVRFPQPLPWVGSLASGLSSAYPSRNAPGGYSQRGGGNKGRQTVQIEPGRGVLEQQWPSPPSAPPGASASSPHPRETNQWGGPPSPSFPELAVFPLGVKLKLFLPFSSHS